MTPQEFIKKWTLSTLKERSGSQEHFIDLCRMLGQKTPAEADPDGTWYTFERGAKKYGGGDGWADVWMKGHFAWEYKGKHKDLAAAYDQLLLYREALENPPLLIVCDMARLEVHTNFTGTAKHVYAFEITDLADPENLEILRRLFTDPQQLRPGKRIEEVTEEAARELATLVDHLRKRGVDAREAAHFFNRILFCLFAEDVGLLPKKLFQRILDEGQRDPEEFSRMLANLFGAMTSGGLFGAERILYFDGGLFTDSEVVPLTREEIALLGRVAALDWGEIEPAIFGTLFERGLDPDKRSQLGAHYTDRGSIMRVVEPVLMAPLRREWDKTRAHVHELLEKATQAKSQAAETRTLKKAQLAIQAFRKKHLDAVRVLDPACGSGNFLYVALELLHELEKEVLLLHAKANRDQMTLNTRVGPHMLKGLEINPYAHELAQVTIWIGHLQWYLKSGFLMPRDPVLKPIEAIECRDALLDLSDPEHAKAAVWPAADVVIGNPPFLGGKKMRSVLQDDYVETLFRVYKGRVPPEADFVTYWFEKARAAIEAGQLQRAGLLATNSIRGGASRKVLDRIRQSGQIFMAWSDEPWVVEGAAVRISLIGFDGGQETEIHLDDTSASVIYSDLTGGTVEDAGLDLTQARRLKENLNIAFMGNTKGGPFVLPGDLAREWLALPPNPNGRPNSDVVRPWVNAMDITRRPRDMWIIDFGVDMREKEAALYEAPFQYALKHVKPKRSASRTTRPEWWLHERPRPEMRRALQTLQKFLVTPLVSKHRLFAWLPSQVLPENLLFAFARDDDFFFGVLQSHYHETWSLRMGTSLEDRPRYTSTSTFETFPLPFVSDDLKRELGRVAAELAHQRDQWVNPPGASAAELKKRTLTNLYNQRPAWLVNAHAALDAAVAQAYGWPTDIPENEALGRLLELNKQREPA